MREALRGYVTAVLEPLSAAELAVAAGELSRFEQAVEHSHDLAAAITDDALPLELRVAVIRDLLAAAAPATRQLIEFAVRADAAGELTVDLTYLVMRLRAEPDVRAGAPPLDPAAGHAAVSERLEGYAAAVLEDADAAGVDAVEEELFRFTRLLDAGGQLGVTLANVDLPIDLRVGIVTDLLRGRADPRTARLLAYAVAQCRSQLVRHLDRLVDQVGEERGRRTATVTAAVALSQDQQARLRESLDRLTGRHVSLQVDLDPSLLGGLRVEVGDTVIDGTVRRRLSEVRTALVSGRPGSSAASSPSERPA